MLAIALAGTAAASTGGAVTAAHGALTTTTGNVPAQSPETAGRTGLSGSTGPSLGSLNVSPGNWWLSWGYWYVTIHLSYQETFFLYVSGYVATLALVDFACSRIPIWPIAFTCGQAAGAVTGAMLAGIYWWARNY